MDQLFVDIISLIIVFENFCFKIGLGNEGTFLFLYTLYEYAICQ
jgi:hypothetical protein